VSPSPLDVAGDLLDRVDGEAQVTVVHERSLSLRFARSAPTQATEVDAHSVHVLCVVDGHTAGATATTLDRDVLDDVARRARLAAEAAARSGQGPYPGLPAPVDSFAFESPPPPPPQPAMKITSAARDRTATKPKPVADGAIRRIAKH